MFRARSVRRAQAASLAAIALVLAGCGSSSNDSASDGGTVTLNVGLFGTFGFKEAGLYDKYMSLHPDIVIKENSVEQSADYYKALQTHLAADSGLDDIQGIEIGFVADVVKNHADQFVDFNTVDGAAKVKSSFYDWKWDMASTSDGKTVGLGTDAGPEAMCYRPDLLAAAGLPSDRATLTQKWATWDGFLDFGKEYTDAAGKQSGSTFLDSPASVFSAAVYQGDLAYDDADGNPIPETSDGVSSAWGYASKAAADGLTAGLSQFSTPWNQAFSNGAFATISCPAWMLGYISGQAGDGGSGHWDVAPLPGGSANWGGSWLGVPTASKHAKEAQDLAIWLTAPEQQVTMWTSQQHFPSSVTAAADPSVSSATSAYFSAAPVGEIFGASAKSLKMTPIGPYDTQVQQAFTTALSTIVSDGVTPDDAWQDALDNVEQVTGG